jgi:hypothetical protein
MSSSDEGQLKARVDEGLKHLSSTLRGWAEAHMVEPREIAASLDPKGAQRELFWLVTDDVGVNDSGYRVVFDPRANTFGLVTIVDGGIVWYLGGYGDFNDAVENM